jgi:hypothetical protein
MYINSRNISLIQQQFVLTHTVRQTEIPALVDSCFTNACHNVELKKLLIGYFRKNITFFSVELLMICQVFCVCCKVLYRWITASCSFMSDMFRLTPSSLC